jgi:glycosyltransferase involved in cell wall biosynthesis
MDNEEVDRKSHAANFAAATRRSAAPSPDQFAVAANLPTAAITAEVGLLTVAIPVYNEKGTLLELLRRVEAVGIPMEILIVDDGSTDGTRELLREQVEGRHANVRVLYHERNRGKGAAIVTAISQATGDYLIVQDADLEYDPNQYRDLIRPLISREADVVYGSRFKGSIRHMKFANRLANRILTIAANILYPGARLTDEATCYKMFRLSLLRRLTLRSRRFDFCPEVTAKVLKTGTRIVEIPIDYTARTVFEGKKIHWTDGVDALWTLIKYRFVD